MLAKCALDLDQTEHHLRVERCAFGFVMYGDEKFLALAAVGEAPFQFA